MHPERREALLKEYGEVSNNFRTLTDIRFRLLTLLPIAAAAAAAFKTDALSPGRLPLSLFGLVATIGLVTYNTRNDQLYDELVGRAAAIERSLQLQDGTFANRPTSWLSFRVGPWNWEINHRSAIATLYIATVTFWLFMSLETVFTHAWGDVLQFAFPETTRPNLAPVFRIMALLSAISVPLWVARRLKAQLDKRKEELRSSVFHAVKRLLDVELSVSTKQSRSSLPVNDQRPPDEALMLRSIAEDNAFLALCVRILNRQNSHEERGKIKARALFYSQLRAEEIRYYVPPCYGVTRAAFLLSLLVDLPPAWISDAATNRRGTVPDPGHRQEAVALASTRGPS